MRAKKHRSKGIVSWPQDERPRERLLLKGADALTDSELVAILIRVGFKGTNAVEMARQLLKQFGSLRGMVEAPAITLLGVKGLKGAKAAQLMAAMEIARRISVPCGSGGKFGDEDQLRMQRGRDERLMIQLVVLGEYQYGFAFAVV
ncbi:MAG: hypothetical protein HC938_06415 [Nitrospira sp.]|nr:hypothetical protein [Nitrospira sp.]